MRLSNWAALLAGGWITSTAYAAPPNPSPGQPLKRVEQGVMSAIQKPEQVTVRSAKEWKALWSRHRRFEKAAPPRVDFSKEQVLGVFLGKRPTGGYAVRIVSAQEVGGKLVVTAEEQKPKPGMLTTEALTAPFCLVSTAKSALPVQWVLRAAR